MLSILALLLLCASVSGCVNSAKRSEVAPVPSSNQPAPPSPSGDMALVPLESDSAPFSMNIPKNWEVQETVSGDEVTIHPAAGGFPKVIVTTRKYDDLVKGPSSEQEELDFYQKMAVKNIKVKTVQWPGAAVAHEVMYEDPRRSPRLSVISLLLYGTTHYTFLDFEAPAEEFSKWEPIFRQMMGTLKVRKLNVEALPGRP